jgi:hypothetical protein
VTLDTDTPVHDPLAGPVDIAAEPRPGGPLQRVLDVLLRVVARVRGLLSSDVPFYPRVLRLHHVHPNGWQRAALVEGMVVAGALAALADKATAWAPLILPVAAAVVVKFHDVLAGLLPPRREPPAGPAA